MLVQFSGCIYIAIYVYIISTYILFSLSVSILKQLEEREVAEAYANGRQYSNSMGNGRRRGAARGNVPTAHNLNATQWHAGGTG